MQRKSTKAILRLASEHKLTLRERLLALIFGRVRVATAVAVKRNPERVNQTVTILDFGRRKPEAPVGESIEAES